MNRPRDRSLAGLLRLIADPDTAVQVVSYTRSDGTEGDSFDGLRPGIDYWPRRELPTGHNRDHRATITRRPDRPNQAPERIRFINSTGTIALMWPESWTYQSDDDGHEVIATRQNREGGDRLVIRLHQPEVLAANWSASLTPDRIEN